MSFSNPRAVQEAQRVGLLPGAIQSNIDRLVGSLKINDHFVTEQLASAITDGQIIRTMNGAGTLTLNLNDQERVLIKSGLLSQWSPFHHSNPSEFTVVDGRRRRVEVPGSWDEVYCTLDQRDYALVQAVKSGNQFDLTFEDRAVHELRKYKRPHVWYRDLMTRAQVMKWMCDEVQGFSVPFYTPSIGKVIPIASVRERPTAKKKKDTKQKGFAAAAAVKMKGALASPQQRSILDRVLTVGTSMNATYKVLLSSIMCVTQESNGAFLNSPNGYGPFSQLRNGAWPASVTDVEADAAGYFKICIPHNASNPNLSPADLVQSVQASGAGASYYAQWETEAKATLALWGSHASSAPGSSGGSAAFTDFNRFAFLRGSNGQKETSWDCQNRLASEVNKRVFSIDNMIYYLDDFQLRDQQPYDTISEDDVGIDEINWDIDSGKPVTQCTVLAHVLRWKSPPGSVCIINDEGPADDRWIVWEIHQPLFTNQCEITLQLPTPPLPEPAPSTRTVTLNAPSVRGSSGPSGGGGGSAFDNLSGPVSVLLSQQSPHVAGHPELKPDISRIVNAILRHDSTAVITSTTQGQHASGGGCTHANGRACDIACVSGTGVGSAISGQSSVGGAISQVAAPQANMDKLSGWIAANLTPALCQGIHQSILGGADLSVNGGRNVSSSFWGSTTWDEHINHIHISA